MTKNQARQDPAHGVDSRESHNRSAVLNPTKTGDMTEPDPPRVLQVRPTLRALKLLPTDEPDVAAERTVFDRAKSAPDADTRRHILHEHRLGQMQYSLLNDVRTILEQGGMPDRHTASSKAAGRTVYEARSHTGAGWRGAFVLEGDVMWLVFASPHDRFHSTAADFIKKGTWLPGELDKKLAAQDAESIRRRGWRVDALTTILDALRETTTEQRPVEFELADTTRSNACTLRLESEPIDEPAPTADLAHTTSGMLTVTLLIRGADHKDLIQPIIDILALVRDSAEEQEQVYLKGGDLQLVWIVSHARLSQLTAAVNDTTDMVAQPQELPTPTALHYVNTSVLAAAFVDGTAVYSLCGQWFVPRLDGSARLPVCQECEERKPWAHAVLDGLRS
ncbi:Protein of unknown function (DUF3039) [Promicromonospora umidemergens]|uniref:DUF3039 domain-containing protein n=1 Tax=Promicromonospora umidemergens TaxID=629679 RepID=A0ABP8WY91_9MICO|nr:DUF3039 domain-containing protein [Promicromonospora umidemergens]MCP2283704.1 Protein of unknown function (DUF3039) [Promicromonospora umidemergens]